MTLQSGHTRAHVRFTPKAAHLDGPAKDRRVKPGDDVQN